MNHPGADIGTSILTIEGLAISYHTSRQQVPAVRGVDLTIEPGEVLALVGESGSGKTTVANAVIGLLGRNATVEHGHIRFGGEDLLTLPRKRRSRFLGARIGLVPQDPTVSLNPTMRIGQQIAEVLRIHRPISAADAAARAEEILDEVGIDRPSLRARQYPFELSGGMKQRILIGIALACRPELVVADEPTSGLDVTVQRRVLDKFAELTREHGTSVLLITHDLGVAVDRADRIVVMNGGRIVEQDAALSLMTAPKHPYTRTLISAAPSLSSARLLPRGQATGPVAGTPEAAFGTKDPISSVLELVSVRKVFHQRGSEHAPVPAVNSVSLSLARRSTLGVVGESGSGKSTLARIIAGFETADSGQVLLDGVDYTSLPRRRQRQVRRFVQLVYQNPYASLDPRFTIADVIDEPLRNFRTDSRAGRRRRVFELLDSVALPSTFAERKPRELSGGQRQRVAIARGLALDPALLILDEPVSALDVSVQAQVLQLLVDLQAERGLSYLFISHDLAVVRQIADTVAVLEHGTLVEHGPVAEVFDAPQAHYTRTLLDAIPGRRLTEPNRAATAEFESAKGI